MKVEKKGRLQHKETAPVRQAMETADVDHANRPAPRQALRHPPTVRLAGPRPDDSVNRHLLELAQGTKERRRLLARPPAHQEFVVPVPKALTKLLDSLSSKVPHHGSTVAGNRTCLEATAAIQTLIEPMAELGRALTENPPERQAWAKIAPQAAAKVQAAIQQLRPLVDAPHIRAALEALDFAQHAETDAEYKQLSTLVARQNALALKSGDAIRLVLSVFWTTEHAGWPALYLVKRSPLENNASFVAARKKVTAAMASFKPGFQQPTVFFGENLLCVPPQGDAEAFALENEAALVFQIHQPSRVIVRQKIGELIGADIHTSTSLTRLFLVGHESGHRLDPCRLPPIHDELFADNAGFVAFATAMREEENPDSLLRALVGTLLENYRPPPLAAYDHSANQLLTALIDMGALKITKTHDRPYLHVTVSGDHFDHILSRMRQWLDSLMQGKVPAELEPAAPPARLAELQATIRGWKIDE